MKRSIAQAYSAPNPHLALFYNVYPANLKTALELRKKQTVAPWSEDSLKDLQQYNSKSGCSEKTLVNLSKLQNNRAVVVATGQQPSLLGGPLYNIYKAFTAIRLAEEIEQLYLTPAVPIFWIASDDHDFEEVRHFSWINRSGGFQRFSYLPKDYIPFSPLSAITIDWEQFDHLIQNIGATTHDTEFLPDLLCDIKEILIASKNFEEHFAKLLHYLLKDTGLVLVPPHIQEIRKRSLSVLLMEIKDAGESSRLIINTADRLSRLGFEPTLHREQEQINFFWLDEHKRRCRLSHDKNQITMTLPGDETSCMQYKKEDFLDLVRQYPERVSYNVVSRPLVQDALFPTVAYVAGPGEIRYFAQLRLVYEKFNIFMPAIFERVHLILLEPRIQKHVKTADISYNALLSIDAGSLRHTLYERMGEKPLMNAMTEAENEIIKILHNLEKQIEMVKDSGIKAGVKKIEDYVSNGFTKIQERYRQYAVGQDALTKERIERILNALFPAEKPQERVLSPLIPFVQNYGTRFISLVSENCNPHIQRKVVELD